MNTNHFEAFKAFAAAQAPDKAINHLSGFKACAIGAYGITANCFNEHELKTMFGSIQKELVNKVGNVFVGRVIERPFIARDIIPTYGKLFEFLDDPVKVFNHAVERGLIEYIG